MLSAPSNRAKGLGDKLEEVRIRFLRLLEEIPEGSLERKLPGENWTIKEELVHIVQVVEIIPAGIEGARQGSKRSLLGYVPTPVRSWINGCIIIPRKARNETRETIGRAYQEAHKILINKLEKLDEVDWQKSMPYPRKFRTIEQMANRPIEHFTEHEEHIRQLLGMKHHSTAPGLSGFDTKDDQ